MVRNLRLIKKAKSFKKKLFSIICQKEKLIRAHCKYATLGVLRWNKKKVQNSHQARLTCSNIKKFQIYGDNI